MPSFQYVARDREGKQTDGVIAAENLADVRKILRNKDLFVTRIQEQADPKQSKSMFASRKVTLRDMVIASRQLATLVRAGLPIVECLGIVAEQSENQALPEVLRSVRLDILGGSSLGVSMRKHPKVFSELYISLVSAGEAGGFLEQTLDMAAEQYSKEADLREKVKAAFVYPVLVVTTSVLVVAAMLVFVVPVFAKVYTQFKAELPAPTKLLILTSNFVMSYWWMIILGAVSVAMLLKKYVKTPKGQRKFDRLKLRLPVMGKLIQKIAVVRFTETFSGTTKAGVPVLQALAVAANTSGNVIIVDAIRKVAEFVEEGSSLSVPMESTGEFPKMVTRMIAAGEMSGNLDEMLSEITRFYDRDIEYSVERLTRMMEPAMTVLVGGIVLVILVALYMPIFNLSQVVRK